MKTGWKIFLALLCSLLYVPDPVQAACRELIDIKNSDCYLERTRLQPFLPLPCSVRLIMKSPRMYLVLAFLLAFGVLALIPIWYALDAIKPEEGGHQEPGGGATVSVEEFESKVEAQMEK